MRRQRCPSAWRRRPALLLIAALVATLPASSLAAPVVETSSRPTLSSGMEAEPTGAVPSSPVEVATTWNPWVASELNPIRLAGLSLPDEVAGEEPFPVTARVFPNQAGARDAVLVLQSPSGQEVEVRLLADADGEHLSGVGMLPPFAESGEWKVHRIYLVDNRRRVVALGEEADLSYRFTVTAAGPADTTPPQVQRVAIHPEEVAEGEPVALTAVVTDNLAGVRSVRAALAPAEHPDPGWWNEVTLTHNPRTGRWEGMVYAPLDARSVERMYVRWVEVQDSAGNYALWQADLEGPREQWSVRIRPRVRVPAPLKADDTLSVLTDSPLPFDTWLRRDRRRVLQYLESPQEPRDLVRTVRGELAALAAEAEQVAGEAYTAPGTGLPVVAPAATGKAWALAAAIRARLLLLLELDSRSGLRPDRPAVGPATIQAAYQNSESLGMQPADRQTLLQVGPGFAHFIAEAVAQSGIPQSVLRAPHYGPSWSSPDFLPDGRLWVLPGSFNEYLGKHKADDLEMIIPLDSYHVRDPMGLAGTVIHELGHHLHMALMGPAEEANPNWQAYLKLRGGQAFGPTTLGHDAWPEENFAEDMVYLYAPQAVLHSRFHLRGFARQSYAKLDEEPEMALALARFIGNQMATALESPLLVDYPEQELTFLPSRSFTVQGRWQPGHEVSVFWIEGHPAELMGGVYSYRPQAVESEVVGADGRFALTLSELPADRPILVMVQARDAQGSIYRSKAFWVLAGNEAENEAENAVDERVP